MKGAAIGERPVRFAGYAAIFDRLDNGGDIIAPGAFAESLKRLTGRELPLLWQHGPEQRIGTIELAGEDERGLRVIGRIDGPGSTARKAAAFLKDGRLDGLSFGYRVVAAEGDKPRRLDTLDLVEVSLVTHPMQPLARVHAVD
ncbi:MAG: HK97 family phage prohead protease [Sphingobium sp.]|nr:HK97 family phage prohead protease [Sphingobium sp.]